MKQISKLVFAACLSLTALPAQAQSVDHEVFITSRGYFPVKIYYQEGDTITFENISGKGARVRYDNGGWTNLIDWTADDQSATITLTSSLLSKLSSKLQAPHIGSGSNYYNANNSADLILGTAPLSCPDNRVVCSN